MNTASNFAKLYTDKYEMRKFAEKIGLPSPKFFKCRSPEEAVKIFRRFSKKMIMKPPDANSSRGVFSIIEEREIERHFDETISFAKSEKVVLLEEYITGTEFTADGIKTDEGHVTLAISEKLHYAHNENIAHTLFFSHLNKNYNYDELKKINDRFVESSGLPFALTHAEYKYRDGKFYLIEIGARGGGNFISAIIVPKMSGVNVYDYLIDKTLRKECNETIRIRKDFLKRHAVLKFISANKLSGTVREIRGEDFLRTDKHVSDYFTNCKIGDKISPVQDDSRRLAYYIAYADSEDELRQFMKKADEEFQIILA